MELELIRWLREHVPPDPRLPLGLSDDAAVFSPPGRGEIVVTTDLLSDDVDFSTATDDPRRVGRKALAVNLSDLAAMAAQPQAAVVSIALPRRPPAGRTSLDLAIALYEGMLPVAREFDVGLGGGDTNTHDGPLVICVTAWGEVTARGPLRRSGGRPGDWLLVTGELGGSIVGRHFDFTPRVREALALHERYELHAGIDISDGLALDVARMSAESGCGAVLYTDRVPISTAARERAGRDGRGEDDALEHALSDGEDFELLLAAPPDEASRILRDQPLGCRITHVGELTADRGLWQQRGGKRQPLQPRGWVHL